MLWMMVIFLLSSRQRITVSETYVWNFLFFKTLHVMEYAALFTLCVRGRRLSGSKDKKVFLHAFLITVLYAMTDEIHQRFVPTREGTVRDVIIDGIGASIIWYYLSIQLPKAPKKLKHWVRSLGLIS